MSLIVKSQKVRDALNSINGLKTYHLRKPASTKAPYCIWQEDSEGRSHYANNAKEEQVLQLTVDYFTKDEYDPMVDEIQSAFNDAEIAWQFESFQYEDETKLLHYEWLLQVI